MDTTCGYYMWILHVDTTCGYYYMWIRLLFLIFILDTHQIHTFFLNLSLSSFLFNFCYLCFFSLLSLLSLIPLIPPLPSIAGPFGATHSYRRHGLVELPIVGDGGTSERAPPTNTAAATAAAATTTGAVLVHEKEKHLERR